VANYLVSLARRGAGGGPVAGTAVAVAPRRVLTWTPAAPKVQPITAMAHAERSTMPHPQRTGTQLPRESERAASDPPRVAPPTVYSNAENRAAASSPEALSRGPDWTPQPIAPALPRDTGSQAAETTADLRPALNAQMPHEPTRAATVPQEKSDTNNDSRAGRQTSEIHVVREREEVRQVSLMAPQPPGCVRSEM